MNVIKVELEGPLILEPKIFKDDRGQFVETFHQPRYAALGIGPFLQDNWSSSKKGVLRGLHFQHPRSQGKLVMVTRGAAWDVIVDVRNGSPSFGKSVNVELTQTNGRQFWIPPGFAHGFVALVDDTEVFYKCTEVYSPEDERSLHWADPELGLRWPVSAPRVSSKDQRAPRLKDVTELPVWGAR